VDGRKLTREFQESYRMRALALRYESNYSVKKISEIFGIHYNSVSRWFCKVRRGGWKTLIKRKTKGGESSLDKSPLKWLEKALAKGKENWRDYGPGTLPHLQKDSGFF
jgi:transposase